MAECRKKAAKKHPQSCRPDFANPIRGYRAGAKRRLIKAASQDEHTTAAWNLRCGYGKLDVRRLLSIEP